MGNLIRMYSEWHSHLLPYYSFDQFVHKVQQVASTKRVKVQSINLTSSDVVTVLNSCNLDVS